MGLDTNLYNIVLAVHIGAAIVGFGGMITTTAYRARALKGGAGPASAILSTTGTVAKGAEYGIYALLVFGIATVIISDGAISMGDPWISASFAVWILTVSAIHALVRPAGRTLVARADAVDPATQMSGDAEVSSAVSKLRIGEGAVHLLLAVALFLMVWQP